MWEQSRADACGYWEVICSLSSLRLTSLHPHPPCCPPLVSFPDVSAIDGIQVLGQTEVSIQVDWKNPPAEVDHFRLTHTDPEGQEEELNVQSSQEARTKHTIVGKCCQSANTIRTKYRYILKICCSSKTHVRTFSSESCQQHKYHWCLTIILKIFFSNTFNHHVTLNCFKYVLGM